MRRRAEMSCRIYFMVTVRYGIHASDILRWCRNHRDLMVEHTARRSAFIPFADRNRMLTHRKRLNRDLASWLLSGIVIASHNETAAANCDHLRFSKHLVRRRRRQDKR